MAWCIDPLVYRSPRPIFSIYFFAFHPEKQQETHSNKLPRNAKFTFQGSEDKTTLKGEIPSAGIDMLAHFLNDEMVQNINCQVPNSFLGITVNFIIQKLEVLDRRHSYNSLVSLR